MVVDEIDDWECISGPRMDVFDDWEIKMDVSDDWETENVAQSCKTSTRPTRRLPIVQNVHGGRRECRDAKQQLDS